MSPLIVEKVAKELYHNSGMTYSDTNYWKMMAGVAILALKDLPDEYFTRVYDKVVWEGIIERIVNAPNTIK